MARKKNTPALTWERVWKAIKDGSLEVKRIPGTRMLLVIKGRIRITWKSRGKVMRTRFRLSKTYLNPRWIPLPKYYPVSVPKLRKMRKASLYALGIIKRGEDDFKLLIYQQLESVLSLQRQLSEHTKSSYERESNNLWKLLEKAWIEEPLKAVEQTALTGAVLDRIEQIDIINTHLDGRLSAVESRLERLSRIQDYVKGALESLLEITSNEDEFVTNGTLRSLVNALNLHYKTLEHLLEDRPHSLCARWARYHINKTVEDLTENELISARRHLQKAIDHL